MTEGLQRAAWPPEPTPGSTQVRQGRDHGQGVPAGLARSMRQDGRRGDREQGHSLSAAGGRRSFLRPSACTPAEFRVSRDHGDPTRAVREGRWEKDAGLARLMGCSPSQKPQRAVSHAGTSGAGAWGQRSAVRAGVPRGVRGRCAPGKQVPPAGRRAPAGPGGLGEARGRTSGRGQIARSQVGGRPSCFPGTAPRVPPAPQGPGRRR